MTAPSSLSLRGEGRVRGCKVRGCKVRGRTVSVWQGRVPFRVHVKGAGPAVHVPATARGASRGARSSTPSPKQFTVYAPEHPGTSPGEPEAIQQVDTLWTLVLCYDELPGGAEARRADDWSAIPSAR